MGSNPLAQKVNFYLAAVFVAAFGLFLTVTVVQTINGPLFARIASPINLEE